MSDVATITRMRERIETLEEENRQLKASVIPDASSQTWRLGLTKTQSAMFERLEKSEMATREALLSVIEQTTGQPSNPKSLDTMIHYMRRRLKGSGHQIRTVWGVGYRLTGKDMNL